VSEPVGRCRHTRDTFPERELLGQEEMARSQVLLSNLDRHRLDTHLLRAGFPMKIPYTRFNVNARFLLS
jgi:hypothetical protein